MAEGHAISAGSRLIVSLTRPEPPLQEQFLSAVQAGASSVELRVDLIGDERAVAAFLQQARPVPCVLTIRAADEGGAWTGSDAERAALLGRLASYGQSIVDLEFAAWERSPELRAQAMRIAGPGTPNRLMLSHHDFERTPADVEAVFARLDADAASYTKAAFAARDARDALRVMKALHGRRGQETIAIAMGEGGICSRVLAPKLGAFATFAAAKRGAESAPGQLTASELIEQYRWKEMHADTPVYGVIGWPVSHSRSPQIHNAAMRAADVDGVYVPLPIEPTYESLAEFLDAAASYEWLGFSGASVTIPHKEHALRWLRERGYAADAISERCGAVNTLARQADGTWCGLNTDGLGALGALEAACSSAGRSLAGANVTVLGAGGAARAIVAALVERNCCVTVKNRTADRARLLAEEMGCASVEWDARPGPTCDVLVNCTSVGMAPAAEQTPIDVDALTKDTIVFDTVYNPRETRLLREAAGRGCTTVSGVEMFIRQAIEQFKAWHGRRPAEQVMAAALGL